MQVHLALALVALLWGLNPPVMKVGLMYMEPMPYNTIRLVAAFAAGWLVFRRMGVWRPLERNDWKPLIVCSLGFFFFQIFFTAGVQITTAGNSSLILGCLPVSVALINHFHRLERINRTMTAGIAVSLAGVIVMVAGTGREISLAGEHVLGAALLLIAQLSYGYYTVFSRRLTGIYSTYQITACILLISAASFLVLSLPAMLATDWRSIPWPGWASILYSGLFPLCLANCLWIWGTSILGSTKASLYNNLPPVFSVITGYLFLNESFGWLQFTGAVIIFLGLYITRRKPAGSPARQARKNPASDS
jgi:drug/metabolite transporter (DMT)-like permease